MANPLKRLKQYFIGDYLARTDNVFDRARIEVMYTYSMLLVLLVWPFQVMLYNMGFHFQFFLNIFWLRNDPVCSLGS